MTKKATRLEVVRQSRDWSYQDLADAIEEATGFHRDQDCWRRICAGTTAKPNRRTQFALDQFFARLGNGRRAAKRQRSAA